MTSNPFESITALDSVLNSVAACHFMDGILRADFGANEGNRLNAVSVP